MTNPSLRPHSYAPRLVRALSWLLRIALAAIFVAAGLSKLAGDPAMVEMFAAIGAGQWLRYAVGLCEVAGAIGVLVPRLAALAASGLALLMIGATVTNVAILDYGPATTLAIFVVAAFTAWLVRSLARAATRPEHAPVSA